MAVIVFGSINRKKAINDAEGDTAATPPIAAESPINEKNSAEAKTENFSGIGEEYGSFMDFPYDRMSFVNDSVYAILKEEYDKIDFSSEFKTGDLALYELYIEKFKQLLDMEKAYINEIGNEIFINELSTDTYERVFNDYNDIELEYYFFDMDEDGTPELTIDNRRSRNGIYIFKYLPETDKIILWDVEEGSWLFLFGSRTLSFCYEGMRNTFYKIDQNSDIEFIVNFYEREDFNKRIDQAETVYVAALPVYMDNGEQIAMTEEMQKQAYIDTGWISEGWKYYYYRVTKAQYNELTYSFHKAQEIAYEYTETKNYSYEELFNNSY